MKKITRKLLLLTVMLTGLVGLTIGNTSTQATANKSLICCSACEVENPPRACRHGCSPSC